MQATEVSEKLRWIAAIEDAFPAQREYLAEMALDSSLPLALSLGAAWRVRALGHRAAWCDIARLGALSEEAAATLKVCEEAEAMVAWLSSLSIKKLDESNFRQLYCHRIGQSETDFNRRVHASQLMSYFRR